MTTAPSLPAPSRAVGVEVLALDVDGVLTDGRLHYGPDGEFVKVFDVKDGLGLKLLERAGLQVVAHEDASLGREDLQPVTMIALR